MKKAFLGILFALIVVLAFTGCHRQDLSEPTDPGAEKELYRVQLEKDTFSDIYLLGENILLLEENGNMTLLSGKTYETVATKESEEVTCLSVGKGVVSYYVPSTFEVVYLDELLVETLRVKLPEGIRGEPAFYAGGKEIFYSIGNEIRALDVKTGVARLLKVFTNASFRLTGVHFDGTLLSAKVLRPEQIVLDTTSSVAQIYDGQTCFYSAVDGSVLWQDENTVGNFGIIYLRTYGEQYYLSRMDGVVYQAIYGDRSTKDAAVVDVLSLEGKFTPLLELGDLLHFDKASNLRLYDMKTGALKAESSFVDCGTLSQFVGDEQNRCVWFISISEEGRKGLWRWNYEKSPATSNLQIPREKVYTSKDPDTEGLKACQEAADAIYEKYGVRVDFWQEAVKAPGNYTMLPEYQPTAIMKRLEHIETVLAQLPESIVKKLVTDDELHIGIVRSIDNSGTIVQYWQDGVAYIAVSVYADIEKHLLLEIFRVMDVYVIGNSQQYDDWAQLNPEDFSYGMQDGKYLEQGNMAFVDGMSMNTPVEDRVRILVAAMQPDNGELFQNPILRSKLQRISDAIRVAYDLEKYPQMLPWEQYLAQIS